MNKSQRCETQEHRKRCSASFINKEMQIKMMRSYFSSLEWQKNKISTEKLRTLPVDKKMEQ